jgi:hypothetical protein
MYGVLVSDAEPVSRDVEPRFQIPPSFLVGKIISIPIK